MAISWVARAENRVGFLYKSVKTCQSLPRGHKKKAEPQPRLSVKSPSSGQPQPCPRRWKYAGASHLRKYLVMNHLQFSCAPRSVFLWRLGCNASWKIRRVAACMADSAKPVAPKFFHVSRSAFTVNHFRHCRLTKLSIIPI